ncbi:MAG: transcriptional regulator [Kineosporiaceae bacterium]|nr:transcriptional regulator [Aeromicrobium sp.]
MTDFPERVAGIGALAEPVRRELYFYVCAQRHAVSRDEAAEAIGVPLHKAKFHLDKLEAEGLLQTEFARLSGKTGPGAGRPSKLYRRTSQDIAVSLPGREYELAGRLMADAIDQSTTTGVPVLEALNRVAAARGRDMGEAALAKAGNQPGGSMKLACNVLAEHGYEPHEEGSQVLLTNCPFHSLSATHTDMVCGMNLSLIDALVDTIGNVECHLDPAAERCCVVLERSAVSSPGRRAPRG